MLYRNGYGSAWLWSNRALKRMANIVTRSKAAGGTGWNQTHLAPDAVAVEPTARHASSAGLFRHGPRDRLHGLALGMTLRRPPSGVPPR